MPIVMTLPEAAGLLFLVLKTGDAGIAPFPRGDPDNAVSRHIIGSGHIEAVAAPLRPRMAPQVVARRPVPGLQKPELRCLHLRSSIEWEAAGTLGDSWTI